MNGSSKVFLFATFKTPMLKTQEKMIGCWIFTSGPVSLSVKIERKGYCNGKQHMSEKAQSKGSLVLLGGWRDLKQYIL